MTLSPEFFLTVIMDGVHITYNKKHVISIQDGEAQTCMDQCAVCKQAIYIKIQPKAVSTIIEASVVCLRFGENGEKTI
jgi:hypothetical protein